MVFLFEFPLMGIIQLFKINNFTNHCTPLIASEVSVIYWFIYIAYDYTINYI